MAVCDLFIGTSQKIVVAACNVATYRLLYVLWLFLWATNKIDEVWQQISGEGSSERDEILHLAIGG